mmetsp:Transcript_6584/g.18226  ORF Transcript_6584/g.18226 Transcript_6584/m.18226 type:complete len:316 (+) Transcript_6584:640-1587(+)
MQHFDLAQQGVNRVRLDARPVVTAGVIRPRRQHVGIRRHAQAHDQIVDVLCLAPCAGTRLRRTGRPGRTGRARTARRARGGRPRRVPASEGKPSHDALDVLFHPAPQRRPLGVLDAATERKQHAVQRPARHHLQKSPGLARRRVLVRHRLEQHRQRNPMRRVLEPGRVKDERHVVRGRVAPNRRKVTIASLLKVSAGVGHDQMKIAHRTRLLDHVPKLLNVHRAIRVDVRRRPIALGQTRRLRHGDPLPLHRLERNAAVQHLLVEYPPRPLPDSPGIDRQRVEHHRHARQPTVRGLVLRSILLDQRKEPIEHVAA